MISYLFIALFATTIGSLVGLGGGVIMKPLMQAFSTLDPLSINVLSSITVFFMAFSTLYKRTKADKTLYKNSYAYLIIGSIIGGIIGNGLFSNFLESVANDNIVSIVQTVILIILLIFVVFKRFYINAFKTYDSKFALIAIGIGLSIISTFLGIGGGPINVPIFIALLGVNITSATYLSILVIFFSQLSNIIAYLMGDVFTLVIITPLVVMIPAAIIGGIVGGKLSQSLQISTVETMFNITIISLIVLNLYNLTLYI